MPDDNNDFHDLPLFNHPQPETEKAVKRVTKHVNPDWLAAALDHLKHVAEQHQFFTGDEVWLSVEADQHMPEIGAARGAMGAVFRAARDECFIELQPGSYIESRRAVQHRKPQRVWRSLIYRQREECPQ